MHNRHTQTRTYTHTYTHTHTHTHTFIYIHTCIYIYAWVDLCSISRWGRLIYQSNSACSKTIKARQTRHVGYCWRIEGELLWTSSRGRVKTGRPARSYIQQLCADTGCSLKDPLGVLDNRDGWRERVRDIRAGSVTWWWWWCMYASNNLSR